MDRFWKKSGGKDGSPTLSSSGSQTEESINSSPSRKPSYTANGNVLARRDLSRISPDIHLRTPPKLKNYEASPTHVGYFKRRSRLSQSLSEVLSDKCARRHFLQFLEANDSVHFLQFWLDADSFQILTRTRLSSFSQQSGSRAAKSDADAVVDSGTSVASCRSPSKCSHTVRAIDRRRLDSTAATTFGFSPEPVSAFDDASAGSEERKNPVTKASENSICSCIQKLHKSIGDDAVNIFAKYIAKDAIYPIGVQDELRDSVTGKICSEDGLVDPACFVSVQHFVFDILEKKFFPSFLQSIYYCRHQLDVLTNGSVSLTDVLYNETSLSFFMEFMEQEGQRDLVEFWLAADNFYQHLANRDGRYNTTEAQDDAMVLYDKYFSLQATCPLEFSQPVRFEVEQNICREEGPLPNCFETAVHIVLTVLEKSYFDQFLGSQLYVKYLTELVNRVETSHERTLERKKRSGSDASSEHSVQTLNTLLAMDGSQPGVPARRILKKFDDDAMRIDTDLFVPDMLWKRPLSGKLRIGYVNGMGQFITEFEPEPDKRRAPGSILSKAVKKFVYKDEDKTKEEMALQVAQMIVQEVLSITLGRGIGQSCKS